MITEEQAWGSLLKGPNYRKGLAFRLAQLAYDKFNGESAEIDLIIEIIVDAARNRHQNTPFAFFKSKDIERYTGADFLKSEAFTEYCEMVELEPKFVKTCINTLIDYFDHGIGNPDLVAIVSEPDPIEEEDIDD